MKRAETETLTVAGRAIELIEQTAGAQPLVRIQLAELLVGADHISAERGLGIGHHPRQIAGEDHYLIAFGLQVERAVALAVSGLEREDQRNEHGRTEHGGDHQHDGPPVRDRLAAVVGFAHAHAASP